MYTLDGLYNSHTYVDEHSVHVDDMIMYKYNVTATAQHQTYACVPVPYGLGQFIALLSETKVVNLYYWCSFKTTLVFCAIYVAGMIACTVAAYPDWVGWTQPLFYIGND